jgi:hypothetical protein
MRAGLARLAVLAIQADGQPIHLFSHADACCVEAQLDAFLAQEALDLQ